MYVEPIRSTKQSVGGALLTTYYVDSRITSRVIPTSPYELWKGVVVESRYVEFFEDKFSRDEQNSSHTTSTSTSREIHPPPPIVEEPMRKTRVGIEKSSRDDFYSYLVEGTQKKRSSLSINLDDDPNTFIESMTSQDAPLWKESINDEMDLLWVMELGS
uniref:Uncharacterized protein n=1 Tax=Lactuca sativa TaxID=4236 RepID=A0A9R1XDR6_LACSA|nr:hypothetical protein LSAT_V11C500284600 [Lactuca sativa]